MNTSKPKALIITGYGINCEEETALAFEKAGGESKIMHVNDLIEKIELLKDCQILAFPGGFSYGDDTGSGNALANKIRNNILDPILDFAREDKLVIGICNGFQIISNLGLVPAIDDRYGERTVALMHNRQARYECRWVHIKNTTDKCIWTKNLEILHSPIAHAEGNFYAEPETLKKLSENDQIVWKYSKEDGSSANGEFPFNPNGSIEDIAGICDPSGRILGMMPHPERFLFFTNKDNWQQEKEHLIREGSPLPEEGTGLQLFKNAIKYFS